MADTSAAIDGNYLYIDGGEWFTLDESTDLVVRHNLTQTLAIDLSLSWTNSTVNVIANDRPSPMPPVRRPSLWYDNQGTTVYEWGGWPYNDDRTGLLWSFQPDGKGGATWDQGLAPSTGDGHTLTPAVGASWVSTDTQFFSLGGAIVPPRPETTGDPSGVSSPPSIAMQGLVSHNFASNPSGGAWSNSSSQDFAQGGYTVFGEASYVPNWGHAGLLVFLGGNTPGNQTYFYSSAVALANFSSIPVYDIAGGKWYYQTASGDVPRPRYDFCQVGASPADNSSFEIFVYGGGISAPTDDEDQDAADSEDVFVLALPAFNWFRASGSSTRRQSHHCQVVGGRQMLVIGGQINADSSNSTLGAVRDPWTNGLGIFDMTNLNWSDGYDAGAQPYEQPAVISQHYTGNPHGPANWDDTNLEDVFATSPSYGNALNASSSGHIPPSPSRHTDVGAIVGGVIGGILAFCLLSTAIMYLRRRQRQSRRIPPLQVPLELADEDVKMMPMHEMGADTLHGSMHELGPGQSHELPADENGRLWRENFSDR